MNEGVREMWKAVVEGEEMYSLVWYGQKLKGDRRQTLDCRDRRR